LLKDDKFMSGNSIYSDSLDFQRQDGIPRPDELCNGSWSPSQKDYARLLHSPSFRRLQGKTQLFPSTESDFFRNRLTHSLEVAQIAAGIARRLNAKELPEWKTDAKIDVDLVQFSAIAHDLGHPPFGHNGEYALDQLMRAHGGYEGNAQTLRILSTTEKKLICYEGGSDSSSFGLNLTYRSLASVLKYDKKISAVRRNAPSPEKGYYSMDEDLVRRIKEHVAPNLEGYRKFKTIECSIMDVADDIAYSTYDLEDSLHAGFASPLHLVSTLNTDEHVRQTVFRKINEALHKAGHEVLLKHPEELLVCAADLFQMATDLSYEEEASPEAKNVAQHLAVYRKNQELTSDTLMRTRYTAQRVGSLIEEVELLRDNDFPQLSQVRLKRDAMIAVELFKHLNFELIIRSPLLSVIEHRGQKIVKQLFKSFMESDGNLLPEEWREEYSLAKNKGTSSARRVICDYVASLTDIHAAELHSRLFSDGQSVFKPL
jgi:dGTPase